MNPAVTLYCRAELGLILVVNVFSVQSLNPARYQSDMERAEVRAIFQKARQKYEGIALKAEEFWPD